MPASLIHEEEVVMAMKKRWLAAGKRKRENYTTGS